MGSRSIVPKSNLDGETFWCLWFALLFLVLILFGRLRLIVLQPSIANEPHILLDLEFSQLGLCQIL